MDKRLKSFAEVEQHYTEKQAQAEAQRCLVCGPCSECLACVRICKPNAVVFRQTETYTKLKTGAIIYAGIPDQFTHLTLAEGNGIYRVPPEDPLMGSAAAAHAMSNLSSPGSVRPAISASKFDRNSVRIGVFICQCGEAIAKIVDTEAICQQAADWKGVVKSQVLPFSCSPEAAKQISDSVLAYELNRVTLAACACCSLDQVCYSCSYQRIRCKRFLDIFRNNAATIRLPDMAPLTEGAFEFVNIREQCAWVHADDPRAATAKAAALVAAAVTKLQTPSVRQPDPGPIDRSALILGSGKDVQLCQQKLISFGISAGHMKNLPYRITRLEGHFVAISNNKSRRAAAVVLIPKNNAEAQRLWTAFEPDHQRLIFTSIESAPETQRPGVFYCDPSLDCSLTGAAAAVRVSAWLERRGGSSPSLPWL
jgi:hypothetical protein